MGSGLKFIGISLIVIGYILAIWGSRLEENDDKSKTFNANFLVFGGIISVIIGIVIIVTKKKEEK